jgi:hypothetical protein
VCPARQSCVFRARKTRDEWQQKRRRAPWTGAHLAPELPQQPRACHSALVAAQPRRAATTRLGAQPQQHAVCRRRGAALAGAARPHPPRSCPAERRRTRSAATQAPCTCPGVGTYYVSRARAPRTSAAAQGPSNEEATTERRRRRSVAQQHARGGARGAGRRTAARVRRWSAGRWGAANEGECSARGKAPAGAKNWREQTIAARSVSAHVARRLAGLWPPRSLCVYLPGARATGRQGAQSARQRDSLHTKDRTFCATHTSVAGCQSARVGGVKRSSVGRGSSCVASLQRSQRTAAPRCAS